MLLVDVSGTTSLSAMGAERASIVASPFYAAIAALVLLARIHEIGTVPFHFWLPNAMEAPTAGERLPPLPTRVKAGVYLIARMPPVRARRPMWTMAVTVAGAATMVVGPIAPCRRPT